MQFTDDSRGILQCARRRLLTVLGLSLALLMAASGTAPAQSDTSGKVTLESKSVALGVGVSWGDGVLEYRGKKYPFTVEGLSVLDLGVAKVSARGEVQNLKKLEDFNGNYVLAAAAGAAGPAPPRSRTRTASRWG